MLKTQNPYTSPTAIPSVGSEIPSSVHEWRGHTIGVGCYADAKTCWLGNRLIITVDGVPQMKSPSYSAQTFHFSVPHNGRLVPGRLIQDDVLTPGRDNYLLTIDDAQVATGTVPAPASRSSQWSPSRELYWDF